MVMRAAPQTGLQKYYFKILGVFRTRNIRKTGNTCINRNKIKLTEVCCFGIKKIIRPEIDCSIPGRIAFVSY